MIRRHHLLPLVVIMFAAGACSDDPQAPERTPTPEATNFAFITGTDYETGSASVIWLDGEDTASKDAVAVHSDAVARFFDGMIYVVNRFGADNIQILDPARGFATVRQFTVDNGADPHDILVITPGKAYVTRYNEPEIWIVDPSTGDKTGEIDLSGLADGDDVPEIDKLARVGDRVFVTVQRIDRNGNWGPVGESYVAVIDATTDGLVDADPVAPGEQPIVLTGSNPFSDLGIDPVTGNLCVSVVGEWGVQDGGVELIDPVALTSSGIIFSEATAQADVTDVVLVRADRGFVITTTSSFQNELVAFNPETGDKIGAIYAPGDFVLQDIELAPDGRLFLTDRSPTQPGIRVFDVDAAAQIGTTPIDVGLPPFDITFGTTTR